MKLHQFHGVWQPLPVTFTGQLPDTFQESRKAARVMRFLAGSVSVTPCWIIFLLFICETYKRQEYMSQWHYDAVSDNIAAGYVKLFLIARFTPCYACVNAFHWRMFLTSRAAPHSRERLHGRRYRRNCSENTLASCMSWITI